MPKRVIRAIGRALTGPMRRHAAAQQKAARAHAQRAIQSFHPKERGAFIERMKSTPIYPKGRKSK